MTLPLMKTKKKEDVLCISDVIVEIASPVRTIGFFHQQQSLCFDLVVWLVGCDMRCRGGSLPLLNEVLSVCGVGLGI